MRKLLWRIFIVAVILAALVPSLAIVSKSIVPLLITLVIGSLFVLLEISPSSAGIALLQYVVIRFLMACILFGMAFLLFQAGISEFSSPYIPSRHLLRSLLEVARSLLGPTPVAILFFTGGGLLLMLGFNYLRTGKVVLTRKTKRGVEDVQP